MKKTLSLILAFIIVLSCGATAFAAVKDPDASPRLLLRYTVKNDVYSSVGNLFLSTVEIDATANDSTGKFVIVHNVYFVGDMPADVTHRVIREYSITSSGAVKVDLRFDLAGGGSYYDSVTFPCNI